MASFNDPKLSNHIADDVPAIRQLLRSVAALDPETGNTDIPNGAKRLVETAQGYEFQSYNGTAWVTLEKWNLDVQKVDGYSASTGTTANTIPVRDANGKLSGDILGNAATATKAAALSATNPIEMGGTGGTTAAEARANLGTPSTNHASSGTEYGIGTNEKYGHVQAHDEPDASLTGDAGHALSPAGAATMQEELAGLIGDAESAASQQVSSLDTTLRAYIEENYLSIAGGKAGPIASTKFTQQLSNIDTTATPTAAIYEPCIRIEDKNGLLYASIQAAQRTNGTNALRIIMANKDGSEGGIITAEQETNGRFLFTAGGANVVRTINGAATPASGNARGVPAGTVIAFAGNSDNYPSGFLLCNGSAVSRSTYADLFSAIGTTYGAGNGSTTFNLPNLTDKFIQGSGTAGTTKNAGLPNVTGKITGTGNLFKGNAPSVATSGAFSASSIVDTTYTGYSDGSGKCITPLAFDASKSSSIYGKSTTVQPPALTMRYYIKY